MLVITRRHGAVTAPDAVDVTELICQHAASRLAALRRIAELEALATRDILTGLGNRGRLDLLLADPTTASGRAGWRRSTSTASSTSTTRSGTQSATKSSAPWPPS